MAEKPTERAEGPAGKGAGSGGGLASKAAPALIAAASGLGLLSWAVDRFLSPGISLAGYVAAIGVALAMVFATIYALSKSGLA